MPVDRHDGEPRVRRRQQDLEELTTIAHHDGDRVAGTDPPIGEGARQTGDPGPEFRPGGLAVFVDQRRYIGTIDGVGVEKDCHQPRGIQLPWAP